MNEQTTRRNKLLAKLPAVDRLLKHRIIQKLLDECPESYVHNIVRKAVEDVRKGIIHGKITTIKSMPTADRLAQWVQMHVQAGLNPKLIRAINGAGVILHTGLGRAPLALSAQEALRETATRYAILATERESGKRGDRNRHVVELLRELTGAEDAMVVNNNSAAVLLALNTFGQGREAIVSRGELVEIGGAFRVPEVMAQSGSIMVEVGTTNKTHLKDYRNAINEDTAYILKVHTSNYRIEGFHQEVPIRELNALARENNLLLLHDIGSGALVDLRMWGLAYEPTVPEAIADGTDVVTFSGDKLIGGPQCGVIVGRKDLIERMKRNPLARALRVDKLILSALDGTLKLFLAPEKLPQTHPIYGMMAAPLDVVKRRARRIATMIRAAVGEQLEVMVEEGFTEMGSGALPARPIASYVVGLEAHELSAGRMARVLRLSEPPLFTRIEDEKVIIDARTIADEEVKVIGSVFKRLAEVGFDPEYWSDWTLMDEIKGLDRPDDDLPALG